MKICSVRGCGRKHYGRGLCRKHYDARPELKLRRSSHLASLRKSPEYRLKENASNAARAREYLRIDPEFRIKKQIRVRAYEIRRRKTDPAFVAACNARSVKSHTKRYNSDPLYKFKHDMRNMVRDAFSRHGFKKGSKTAEILGCSFKDAMVHVGWFPGCQIHHIVFLKTAQTKEDIVRLNHHTNLVALTKKQHMSIHAAAGKDVD